MIEDCVLPFMCYVVCCVGVCCVGVDSLSCCVCFHCFFDGVGVNVRRLQYYRPHPTYTVTYAT